MQAKPSPAKKNTSTKPLRVKVGNVTVKIYAENTTVDGATYPRYTLAYYSGTQRIRKRFADLEEAKREATLAATKLANGENEVLKLTSEDRASYLEAKDLLAPMGARLTGAVSDYVAAVNRLPAGVSLFEAVDAYCRRNSQTLEKRTVSEIVVEMVEAKRKAGRAGVHLKDLESRLGCFARAFAMDIGQVTGGAVQAFLDGIEGTNRTRRNHLAHIKSLFRFAVKRRYLSKDALDEIASIERPADDSGEIEIFTPAELAEIFDAARPEMIPWLAIAAFAGIRHEELQRLDWSAVNLPEGHIELKKGQTKTAARRLAPVTDNLAQWLAPHAKKHGRISAFDNVSKQLGWLVEDINAAREKAGNKTPFKWKHNGLRHSFVSYRLADIKDAAQVALECGNSPAMLFRNYLQLVTAAEAAKWFAITPAQNASVIPINAVVNQ